MARTRGFVAEGEALPGLIRYEQLQECLAAFGREDKRRGGKLPGTFVMLLCVYMGLYRQLSIPNVLARLAEIVGQPLSWGGKPPCGTAIAEARSRVGFEAVRAALRVVAQHLAGQEEYRYRGLPVYNLDGTCLGCPDTEENRAEFGRAGSPGGEAGFPLLRAVWLTSPTTYFVRAAAHVPYRGRGTGEAAVAKSMFSDLAKGTVICGDRLFATYDFVASITEGELNLVTLARTGKNCASKLRRVRPIGAPGTKEWEVEFLRPRSYRGPRSEPIRGLRLIKTKVGKRAVHLLTTLLDPVKFLAHEILEIYRRRWESEMVFREVKAQLLAKDVPLRSKTPERVKQELYGILLAYSLVRAQMREAAGGQIQPWQLSFNDSLFRIRSGLEAPDHLRTLEGRRELYRSLRTCVLPPRRTGRSYPRALKSGNKRYPSRKTLEKRELRRRAAQRARKAA